MSTPFLDRLKCSLTLLRQGLCIDFQQAALNAAHAMMHAALILLHGWTDLCGWAQPPCCQTAMGLSSMWTSWTYASMLLDPALPGCCATTSCTMSTTPGEPWSCVHRQMPATNLRSAYEQVRPHLHPNQFIMSTCKPAMQLTSSKPIPSTMQVSRHFTSYCGTHACRLRLMQWCTPKVAPLNQ